MSTVATEWNRSQALKTAAFLCQKHLPVKAVTLPRGYTRAVICISGRGQPQGVEGRESVTGVDDYGLSQHFAMRFKGTQLVWERRGGPYHAPSARTRATIELLLRKHHHRLCGLELGKPSQEQWVTILPDVSRLGYFKVQYLSPSGLAGHISGYVTPAEALLAAVSQGFTQETPGIVGKLITTKMWQERYRLPNDRQPPEAVTPK